MSEYIIRIRLEKAKDEDYLRLVESMKDHGYLAVIKDKEGNQYIMPLGNFRVESGQDKNEILDHVNLIVSALWKKKYQILVTGAAERANTWIGLKGI
jgi:hypothetical protein